jgi:hypothetical protein
VHALNHLRSLVTHHHGRGSFQNFTKVPVWLISMPSIILTIPTEAFHNNILVSKFVNLMATWAGLSVTTAMLFPDALRVLVIIKVS